MKRTKRVKPTQKAKDVKVKQYTREELETLLNPRHQLVAREYCANAWNKTQAYKRVYSTKDKVLSDDVCRSAGVRLFANVNIQQYVEYLKKDTEELIGISKEKNLRELARVAYSSIEYLHDTWIELKEYYELTSDQLAAIKDTETKVITTEHGTEITTVKIILHPKLSAIETINKMMGYNATEQIKVQQTVKTEIDITKYTDEEKKILLQIARKNEYI